ncbi:MAG TPA: ABC transporter permease [Streptosporangiaceae bacterium]|jgi:ABC-type transport system involved in multi-copper enzyme maturation permease subunit
MLWLSWRQFRAQALVGAAVLAVAAVALGLAGASLAHLYAVAGVPGCQAAGGCARALRLFSASTDGAASVHVLELAATAMSVVPGLVGVFWGAPLVARELETGTHRLAWTQSVTRARWLAVKLVLVGLAGVVLTGLLSLMVTAWSSPLNQLNLDRFAYGPFGEQGIVPAGYAAFGFVLGVTAGLLIRRTLPAMAATLLVFTAIRMGFTYGARRLLMAPLRVTGPLNLQNLGLAISNHHKLTLYASGGHRGAWIYSVQVLTPAGRPYVSGPAPRSCTGGDFRTCLQAISQLHLRQIVTFQPASRFWAFQWYETGLFILAAVALAAACVWWIRRRMN